MIRVPVEGIRIAGRATKGVTIFNTADGERVVSVERIPDQGEEVLAEAVNDASKLVDDASEPEDPNDQKPNDSVSEV